MPRAMRLARAGGGRGWAEGVWSPQTTQSHTQSGGAGASPASVEAPSPPCGALCGGLATHLGAHSQDTEGRAPGRPEILAGTATFCRPGSCLNRKRVNLMSMPSLDPKL